MKVNVERPLDEVRRLIVSAVRAPAGILELRPRELDLTLRVLRRARLLGRLAADLQALGQLDSLPAMISDQLYSALVVAEARARVARWELDRIAWALRDLSEVPLIVLKGCAYLLAGTPNARGRTFSDVDLLVPERHLADVEARLRQQGWCSTELTVYDDRYYRVWAHELPPLRHGEREVEVDLHHNILMRTARLKPDPKLLFDAARPLPGSRFSILAPADMVLHAIVHLFYGGEMDDGVRELVDIVDLVEHFHAREGGSVEALSNRAQALDLAGPAFYGLRYAQRILGTPVIDHRVYFSQGSVPAAPTARVMDWLVPRALLPAHPERPDRRSALARLMLYGRSHWVRMPTLLLLRHLFRKFAAQSARVIKSMRA